ncbi:MAG: HAMP domain-containing sensor histidine kinase [Dehalococcoidia bacterium]
MWRRATPPLRVAPAAALPQPTTQPPAWAGIEASTLVEPLSDAVLILDENQTVLAANAAASLLSSNGAPLVGRSLVQVAWSTELDRLAHAAAGVASEVMLSGQRTVRAIAVPLSSAPPRVALVLTERPDTRRADRARSELVANLSHELRTPVAAARALAETLESGIEDNERRQRYERQLITELDRLATVIDRSLHLSRIEAAVEAFDPAPCAPAELLRVAVQLVAPLADAQHIEIANDADQDLPPVLADLDRIVEVLTVLLDNALKFSPPGGRIDARAFRAGQSDGSVTFEVRDRGPGILPSERERVFERLYTGDPARGGDGRRAGFGFGLAIARHIVARHGGRIWVADEPGPGATLRFTLPIAPLEAAPGASG